MNETWIKAIAYSWYIWALAIFEYLDLEHTQFIALTIFMIADVITWVLKQWRINPQGITSNRLAVWLVAKMLILASILLIALWIKTIGTEWITIAYLKWAISFLMIWELYSVLENVYAFNTKKELPEFDVFSKFFTALSTKIKDALDVFFKHKD